MAKTKQQRQRAKLNAANKATNVAKSRSAHPSKLRLWVAGARLRTLPLAVAPVAIGAGIAAGEQRQQHALNPDCGADECIHRDQQRELLAGVHHVQPYAGARCISTMRPARDCEAKGSALPARLMRYESCEQIQRTCVSAMAARNR